VFPDKSFVSDLQDYMIAYIRELQRLADLEHQFTHLGWTTDHQNFILPGELLEPGGKSRSISLSLGAQRASHHIGPRGEFEKQVELLKFYNHPKYLPSQFMICASLAAPLYFATGQNGVIVNASGDSGASKSTTLYTAASLWGRPEMYPLNGTDDGATIRFRNERITTLANLPILVDEITHMPIKDAHNFAMSVSQPGQRGRLGKDGVERAAVDSYRATITLCTANSSLHQLLAYENSAGSAGSMRVVEIVFKKADIHKKWEADDFMRDLKKNYGHVGPAFMRYVVDNREWVEQRVHEVQREIDMRVNVDGSERFWTAAIASVIVACEIANHLGLLAYDRQAMMDWAVKVQIPSMRGTIQTEYDTPIGTLADYMEHINADLLITEQTEIGGRTSVQVLKHPRGPLAAHYDKTGERMFISKTHFKDYCMRRGANADRVLKELNRPADDTGSRVIPVVRTRRRLGAGTDYAKGQPWCFIVDMSNPEVTGTIDLEVVDKGGSRPMAPAKGNLRSL